MMRRWELPRHDVIEETFLSNDWFSSEIQSEV